MGGFFAELKRRQMFRVAAAYAVVAWLLLQIVNNVAPVLDLPVWVARAFLLALVIGFPIALLFVWMRELAPVDGGAPKQATTKLDYVLAGGLIIVIAVVSYQQLAPSVGTNTVRQAAIAGLGGPPAQTGISIAVLPFANLSGDASQEFFSDGMTEEITAALAKIPNIQVIGRTSAFQFKGQSKDFAAIRQALGVAYLIDGSVRKEGDRVRITAQLVRADSGANLWTESYDRQLSSVFATQEEIARAIAAALSVPLGLQQGDTLVSNRTNDLDTYEQYLRAKALYRSRSIDDAIAVLEPLVMRDPNFAPAWALLAAAYVPALNAFSEQRDLRAQRVEVAAREAIRLDTRSALAYGALADRDSSLGRWAAGEDGFRQALSLDPNEPDVLNRYSTRLAVAGRMREGLALKEKLLTLEPFVPIYNVVTARFMINAGRAEAAIPILERFSTGSPELARAYAAAGRFREAADAVLATPTTRFLERRSIEAAAQLLRTAPQQVRSSETLPALPLELIFVYLYVGAPERVLPEAATLATAGFGGVMMDVLWQPESAPLRKTERFKTLMRTVGLVDYWRARGWPDLCRPVGADDFECD
jgi:TolB-like protein